MVGSLEDKIAYFILLAIAMLIGYCAVIFYALRKFKGPSMSSFIKEKGYDLSMVVLVSISGSFLTSLCFWAVAYFVLTSIVGITINRDQRFMLIYGIYVITFFSFLIYGYRSIIHEK